MTNFLLMLLLTFTLVKKEVKVPTLEAQVSEGSTVYKLTNPLFVVIEAKVTCGSNFDDIYVTAPARASQEFTVSSKTADFTGICYLDSYKKIEPQK